MDAEYWAVFMATLTIFLTGVFVVFMVPLVASAGLVEDVRSAPYKVTDYDLNVFDCTDMSALMEVHLTQRGHDARILTLTRQEGNGHAMVIVYNDTENSCYYVECTAKRIVSNIPSRYTIDGEYDDIIDAVENSRWGVGEWGLKLYMVEKGKI